MDNKTEVHLQLLNQYVERQLPKLQVFTTNDYGIDSKAYSLSAIAADSDMSERDIVETFRLSLITESLTEQYAETYKIGAKRYDAQWLSNYVVNFWEPDEFGHAEPFKNILTDFGLQEDEIERDIQYARQSTQYHHHHSSGFHPVNLTTYGIIQECITDYWYELQRNIFPIGTNAAKAISKVKGREALHTVQFRDLTALQFEADPFLIEEIINAVITFQMPANHIPPVRTIAAKTQQWIPMMNGNVTDLLKRIINEVHLVLGDKEKLGILLTSYASESEKRFISFLPNTMLAYAIGAIHGGHGLVGEIIVEELGLHAKEKEIPSNFIARFQNNFKDIIKRWVKDRLEFEGLLREPTNKTG